MKGKTRLLINSEAIDIAIDLGITVPQEEYKRNVDFYFDSNKVDWFLINEEGGLNISVNGSVWSIDFDKDIYNHLIEKFT